MLQKTGPDPQTNEFVVKFANVNGSGSASANLLFAKSLFRMGLMVAPKNIFPSNIQGLPTWYEVRVSAKGYIGRREGIDLMVAMNPQTFAEDVAEIVPGGVLFYDSSWPRDFGRDDITVIGVPIAKMCAAAYTDSRQRQLYKNIVYVGALSVLLDMDFDVIQTLLGEQFAKKPKLIDANIEALEMGRQYVRDNLEHPLAIRTAPCDTAHGKIMISGNEAAGLGAVYAGATVAAWYPITPSTSLAEAFETYLPMREGSESERAGAVVQAEDELAAVGIAIGANWNGARAFTATSGPGISLMGEFIGLAYFAEIPLVIFDIQRGGPSTGMPTRTQQSDVLACAYASHGDTKHVLLFPADPGECFTMGADAFDLADRLQTPVFVMSDLDIGMNDWVIEPFAWDDARRFDRGKVLDAKALDAVESFGRYLDVDGDGIAYRTYPGTHPTKGAYFTRGTSHDEYGRYTEDGRIHAATLRRLTHKFETAATLLPKPEIDERDAKGRTAVINFGGTDAAVREALDLLESDGVTLNHMRVRAFPFAAEVLDFIARHDTLYVVEQNRDAQLRHLLIVEGGVAAEKLVPLLDLDGMPLAADFVRQEVLAHQGRGVARRGRATAAN